VQFDALTNEFSLLSNVTVDNAQVSQGQYVALSCPCREDTYCLVNSGNACGTHRSSDAVSCFSLDSRTIFVRNAWPVVVLWYGALFIFLIATDNGRHARAYICGLICKSQTHRMADRILENELRIRDRMRVAALLQQRRMILAQQQAQHLDEEDNTASLALKTRIYKKESSDLRFSPPRHDKSHAPELPNTPSTQATEQSFDFLDEELGRTASHDETHTQHALHEISLSTHDDDEVVCTICLGEVEEGDRVGELNGCNHLFHSDCLKDWLRRRNVCPLCQTQNVAARRIRRQPTSDSNLDLPQLELAALEDANTVAEGLASLRMFPRTAPTLDVRDPRVRTYRTRGPNGEMRVVYRLSSRRNTQQFQSQGDGRNNTDVLSFPWNLVPSSLATRRFARASSEHSVPTAQAVIVEAAGPTETAIVAVASNQPIIDTPATSSTASPTMATAVAIANNDFTNDSVEESATNSRHEVAPVVSH